ncbi:MAG: SsrA-binding protein SmpB [Deltaproteobacteria bacterium]|nr:SsrA-binding protein SmpB [Deltaproteobacteria bacterium]
MIVNRRAYHDYEILETFEAGIVLRGAEVKSLREGMANLKGSYAEIREEEVWLLNFHISPYPQAGVFNPDPDRDKKLLLHKQQIRKLTGKVKERGLTLIPLKVYFKNGKAKVEIALAKGRKLYDKRRVLKEKELRREKERALKEY